MKIRRAQQTQDAPINLTSLMDLMFILLIFYVATTKFQEEDFMALDLPDTREQSSMSADSKLIVINVRKPADAQGPGKWYVVSSEYVDLNGLKKKIKDAVKKNKQQKVLIRAEGRAFHDQVAAAAMACRNAGMTDMQIGYDVVPMGVKQK